jgi:thioesterase domain-containing protein
VEHDRTSSITEALIHIWQSVLRRSPIRLEDNFFEVGGDPTLAVKIFDEIAEACGREMPPLVIYHAPTIAALAASIQQSALPKFSPLVPLKDGDADTPVFVAHGLGGSVMEFFELVKNMQTSHPIYGLQAMGPDGADIAFERIEDIAQFYIEAIRQRQPLGPYLFIGYSLGGLVALEMAQRLSSSGEKIGLLTMLDAYPFESFLGPWQRALLIPLLLKHHASIMKQLPPGQALSYVLHPATRALHSTRKGNQHFVRGPFTVPMRLARDGAYVALTRYQPRPYGGKVRFVKAAKKSVFPSDPAAVWARWINDLEVETVPGDHYAMLREHFDSLARVLSRHLREASS